MKTEIRDKKTSHCQYVQHAFVDPFLSWSTNYRTEIRMTNQLDQSLISRLKTGCVYLPQREQWELYLWASLALVPGTESIPMIRVTQQGLKGEDQTHSDMLGKTSRGTRVLIWIDRPVQIYFSLPYSLPSLLPKFTFIKMISDLLNQ